MNRIKFVDRMAQGKVSRRDMLKGAAAFGVGMVTLPAFANAAGELTVLEWAGYDAPDYYKSFVAKHGGPPAFSIFAAEEEALQKVRGGFAADIMHPCNYSVGRFVEAKLVKPIDTAKLSNWKDLFPSLQTAAGVVQDGQVVMAPSDWGNSSIAYRPDLVDPEYREERVLGDLHRRQVCRQGLDGRQRDRGDRSPPWSVAPSTTTSMRSRARAMAALKPAVEKIIKNSRFLWDDPTTMIQALASGEIVAAYAWNDTPKNLKAQGVPVAFAKPKEGYFTWYCGMTILNSGKGDDAAAHDFVDAWLSPETGKYLIEASGYGHSNAKSFAAADPEAVKAMGITDPMEHMASAILFQTVPSDILAEQIKFWEELKALKQ